MNLFDASDILTYILYPLFDFIGESFEYIIFQTFFFGALACMSIIGAVHIIRRIMFERLRREVF